MQGASVVVLFLLLLPDSAKTLVLIRKHPRYSCIRSDWAVQSDQNILPNLKLKSSEDDEATSTTTFGDVMRMEEKDNIRNSSIVAARQKIEMLKREKEIRSQELLATELALKRAEVQLQKQQTILSASGQLSNMTTGTYDYGFVSKSYGDDKTEDDTNVPPTAWKLALFNFRKELFGIISGFDIDYDSKRLLCNILSLSAFLNQKETEAVLENTNQEARRKLTQLTLSNKAIWDREAARPPIVAPWVIKAPYYVLCILLDALFDGMPISRFYFLETVARMPYFSYITMLHTYETLGWWRRSKEAKRVHFAEEYNEFHHLLIWESLGGDQAWRFRFFAQHSAIVYYFVLLFLWGISPSLAYNFSELIEAHAVDTYAEFAEANKELLQSMSAPPIAKQYYEAPDMYVFDEFQTNRAKGSRRPVVNSLYDVVCNIRDDEAEHVATMAACQDPEVVLRSPNTEAAIVAVGLAAGLLYFGVLGNTGGVTGDDVQSLIDASPSNSLIETATSSLGDAAASAAAALGVKLSTTVTPDTIEASKDGIQQVENVAEDNAATLDSLLGLFGRILEKLR